jgi:hypothetical protein
LSLIQVTVAGENRFSLEHLAEYTPETISNNTRMQSKDARSKVG